MSNTIPWEDASARFFDRFWTTVWAATSDPVGTFTRVGAADGDRDLLAAARFAVLASVVGWAPFVLLSPCLAIIPFAFAESLPDDVRALGTGLSCLIVGAMPFVFVLGSVGVELVHGAVFHVLSRILGGVGDVRRSFHAMLYTSAIRFWLLPALFLGFVPFIGTLVHLSVRMGFVIWSGFACYGAARGAHGLDDSRSVAVAILAPLLSVALVSFCIAGLVFAFVLTFAGTLGLGSLLPGAR